MSGLSAWLMAYPILLERIKSNMGAAIGILVCDKSSGHRPLLAELGRPGRSTRRQSADKLARHSETLGVDDRDVQLHEHIAQDRKSTRLNSRHLCAPRMPFSARTKHTRTPHNTSNNICTR